MASGFIDRSRHRCVLFDVDGTIAETEGLAHLPAFNRALEEAGLPWRWTKEDYARLLKTAGGFERLLRFAEETGNDPGALRNVLSGTQSQECAFRIHHGFRRGQA